MENNETQLKIYKKFWELLYGYGTLLKIPVAISFWNQFFPNYKYLDDWNIYISTIYPTFTKHFAISKDLFFQFRLFTREELYIRDYGFEFDGWSIYIDEFVRYMINQKIYGAILKKKITKCEDISFRFR